MATTALISYRLAVLRLVAVIRKRLSIVRHAHQSCAHCMAVDTRASELRLQRNAARGGQRSPVLPAGLQT